MWRALGVRQARRAAAALLARCGIREAQHIDVARIAGVLGVDLVEGGLVGARARVTYGVRPVVRISDAIGSPVERRFSLAHELGHLVLQHPAADADGRRRATGGSGEQRDLEAEANAFAAELLMPTSMVRARCDASPLDLSIARDIAAEFAVPIDAAARRIVELTSERAAVVYASAGAIVWAYSSDALPWRLKPGQRLDKSTVAADYFRGLPLDERPQPIEIAAWFACERRGDAELVEHSIVLRDTAAVLSLLWIPEVAASRLHLDDDESADSRSSVSSIGFSRGR